MARIMALFLTIALVSAFIHGMITGFQRGAAGKEEELTQEAPRTQETDWFPFIGLRLDKEGIVAKVWPGMPADHAGIDIGDKLTAIDGVSIDGLSRSQRLGKLRGPIGSVVTLAFLRDRREREYKLTRKSFDPTALNGCIQDDQPNNE
jgi:carboxyl-terminal processing protease